VSVAASGSEFAAAGAIAARFVRARLDATALAEFPGPLPPDRPSAYACQEAAIALWPDVIDGWKVGRPAPGQEIAFGADRLAGPIFRRAVRTAEGVMDAPFIEGGFAAVEAEFVLRLGRDAPAGKTDWVADDAAQLVGAMHIGVEMAGSPLALINALGPTVTVSDFGNNAGLLVGPAIADWCARGMDALTCETFIDDRSVGRGAASSSPGGPLDALCWLLGHCARRGRPLKAGQLVSTGAATGVHEISIGQSARMSFGADGEILCRAVKATPQISDAASSVGAAR
jgi:2-keto-4-pentenoate hydratase